MSRLIDLLVGDRRDPRPVPASGTPPKEALVWARSTLDSAGVRPERDRSVAIAALRRAKDLGLRPTTYLVDHLAEYHSQ